jgi:predicted nucleic acid-binding protein
MYTLDTNAIIYYLKDDPVTVPILSDIFAGIAPVYVSAITEVELFGFPSLETVESERIEAILQTVAILSLDSRIARIAGTLRRTYGLKIPDSVIAATALFTNTTLLTRNSNDFKKVIDLNLLKI